MNLIDLLLFAGGLSTLLVGGDALVRGASSLARSMGISPLVVGLTVVAFGTSAPELAVSMTSALQGAAPIALGNVVGSNVFNVLLVLGGTACMTPLVVRRQFVRFDVPILVAASFALAAMSLDGLISHVEAALLFAALVLYVSWTVKTALRDRHAPTDEEDEAAGKGEVIVTLIAFAAIAVPLQQGALSAVLAGGLVVAGTLNLAVSASARKGARRGHIVGAILLGLVMVAGGAQTLVIGAVNIARSMGISEAVIGLTVVAAGTSAPEAVTSVMAARRNEADLAIGNIVGSNIFNVLCIVGLTGLAHELPVPQELMSFDYPFMLLMTLGLWPLLWWRGQVRRADGVLMLVLFVGYMAVQVWRLT